MKLHKELKRQRRFNTFMNARGAKPKTFNRFQKKMDCYHSIIMGYFLDCHPINLEEMVNFIEKNMGVLVKAYKQMLFSDYLSKPVTSTLYNYEDFESMIGNIDYISDRLWSYYHLARLINLPENYRKLKTTLNK